MIKLKKILLEHRATEISREEFMSLIGGKFAKAYDESSDSNKPGGVLYRADSMDHNKPFWIMDPSKHTRRSMSMGPGATGTTNFHTALIDVLPSWKEWPKRSKCVIFTNDYNDAKAYGNEVWKVFPENDAKIVICPEKDFWHSFMLLSRAEFISIRRMNEFFQKVFDKMYRSGYLPSEYAFETITPPEILEMFSEADSNCPKEDMLKIIESTEKSEFVSADGTVTNSVKRFYEGSWLGYFDTLMNPESNHFKLGDVEDAYNMGGISHEMYTENTCLFTNIDI